MKKVLYFLFIFSILLMSWDAQKQDTAIAETIDQTIPNEAIRLRIIANSDSAEDQLLKRQVRDEIIAAVNPWVDSLNDLEGAREIIRMHLPELKQLVSKTIADKGYQYTSTVELGLVPFPTKMYGQTVYPAGDYEALRVTIGDAQGQNWWCVLFPPLCFVDMSTSDAVQKDTNNDDNLENTKTTVKAMAKGTDNLANDDVEVRFFIIELLAKLFSFMKSMF